MSDRKRPEKSVNPGSKPREKDQPEWLDYTDHHAVITLNVPLEVSGVMTSRLEMRRPKLKDRREADRQFGNSREKAEEKEEFMFCNLTDLTPDELNEIDLDDYVRLQRAFQGFLSSAPKRSLGAQS